MGLIYDKSGKSDLASNNYMEAMVVCEQDEVLKKSATYKKASTNYAVTLEKLDRRELAVATLEAIKNTFHNEVRV